MARLLFLLIGALPMIFGACSSELERNELIGEYRAGYSFGTETLQLNLDGTYVQKVTLQGETESTSHSGTWDYAAPRKLVIVQSPLQFSDHFGKLNVSYKLPVKGTWNLRPEKLFGKVSLVWNEDAGVKFEKIR